MREASQLSVRERNPVELLQVAEQLFAVHGIDGVSLRQIGSAAGHRNPAVVQYHFGSKTALLQAILEYRLPPINAARLEFLDRMRSEGRQDELRALVESMVRPLVDLDPHTNHYVAFLARLMSDPEKRSGAYATTIDHVVSAQIAAEGIKAALTELSEPLRRHRHSMAVELMMHTIANRQSRMVAGEDQELTREEFETDLVDAMVGLLTAPPTFVEGR
ncbi:MULTISPECIES: TetR family transcriptional regulator [Rhodococcus]|uniref:TetR family transcriptional regulator n=1 Tax=Nocardia globerula TaxID=1818 RepID=A0A652YIB5_NOCGL|nr:MULTISPECIES: TetR family transcriptional regulator [Rhodococcus]MDV8071068.1 TetR/AcrR family transcriptional regulator [Rhodococcus sp. IEGM 1366]NMD64298.1 TetR/AcrR family transcriptional regulator [Nocardia globerula]PVX63386.1 TetR family transcriptional regulator [Rhodococcus globerulus]RZL21252.1 MAG: TetR/AcrR family transcriptional regulator [Rhodococcus sp. (in: high G+C Gram-positive bacteria)]